MESGDSIPKLEIHALNDLNSEEWKPEKWVNMELCKFIRVEKKFESIDQLREQISGDKQTAIQWFEENDQKLNLKGWTPTSGSSSNFFSFKYGSGFWTNPSIFPSNMEKPSFGRIASMLTN